MQAAMQAGGIHLHGCMSACLHVCMSACLHGYMATCVHVCLALALKEAREASQVREGGKERKQASLYVRPARCDEGRV